MHTDNPSVAYRNNSFLDLCGSSVPKSETGNGSLHLRYKEFGSVGQWMRNRTLNTIWVSTVQKDGYFCTLCDLCLSIVPESRAKVGN